MALKVFTSARAALESVRGTDLTPTRLIYAEEFTWEQDVASIRPVEYRNSYVPVFSAAPGREVNRFRMRGRASYDDLAWLGQMFFKSVASTGANPYVWTFTPTNTSDDVKTMTLQMAESDTIASAPGVKLNFLIGESLTLRWTKDDDSAMTFDAAWLSAKGATELTAFTGSLTDRTTTMVSCNNTTVYVDQASAIGTTADDTIVSVEWTLNLAPAALYTLNASTAARAVYRPNHRTWTANVTRQYTSNVLWGDYVDKTTQKVRVKTTTGASAIAQVDFYGTIVGRSKSDVDGITTEELQLENIYDVTSSSDHSMVITNTVQTIT